jgi:hypothetical protein
MCAMIPIFLVLSREKSCAIGYDNTTKLPRSARGRIPQGLLFLVRN